MSPSIVILISIAAICVLWAVASAVMITAFLDRRGVKTPFPFMGPLIFRNLSRYREITKEETGKIGFLYYSSTVSITAALVLVIVAFIIRTLRF